MSDDEAVTRAVADLYALDRDAFVSARDEAAAVLRKAGDRTAAAAIKKLGRPTVAAWAVNQLVRANPALIERLTDFGVRLRDAQSALDAGELRALRPDRDALLDEVVHAAATVAATRGQPLSAAAEDDVRATFVAALADPAAAVALGSGRLVRTLSYAGFGEVSLDDAVANLPDAAAAKTAPPKRPPAKTRPPEKTRPPQSEPAETQVPGSSPAKRATDETAQPAHQAARQVERERADARARATRAAAEAQEALRDAERQATAAALAEADAEEQAAAARRRTAEIRSLLASAERDEQAAAEHAQVTAAEARQARDRVAAATAAWTDATEARDALA